MKHPMVILPLKKKEEEEKITSFSFCATANIATFLGGKGKLFCVCVN